MGLHSLFLYYLLKKYSSQRDFEDLARKTRCNWYFQNDKTESFSQIPAFQNKSSWDPPKGYPALEIF